jgi:hypothetical protein
VVPAPRTVSSGLLESSGFGEHGDDLLERALLGQALLEPHVPGAHVLAGPRAEGLLSLRDQLAELVELRFVFR